MHVAEVLRSRNFLPVDKQEIASPSTPRMLGIPKKDAFSQLGPKSVLLGFVLGGNRLVFDFCTKWN